MKDAASANLKLVEYLFSTLGDGRREARELRRKLTLTYWLLVVLCALLFLVGLLLISSPLWSSLVPNGPDLPAILTAVGVGFVDFVGLLLYNPIARIQKLMGDTSQVSIILTCLHIQVALRLLEADTAKRETIGTASLHIGEAEVKALGLVEDYYEKWLDARLSSS